VNANPAPMTVEKLFCARGKRLPIAVENIRFDEALKFQIPLLVEEPVAVDFKIVKRHGGAENGEGSHENAPVERDRENRLIRQAFYDRHSCRGYYNAKMIGFIRSKSLNKCWTVDMKKAGLAGPASKNDRECRSGQAQG
jgi:hypothetical protein